MEIGCENGQIKWGDYNKNAYDKNASSDEKMAQISEIVRLRVARAKEIDYAVSMEILSWERDKQKKTKFAAYLHKIIYMKVQDKVRRECAKMGVPFRLVRCEYSSLLGNILSTLNCKFSRDVASAGVIALRACDDGDAMILSLITQVVNRATMSPDGTYSFRLRINEKKMFGRHVEVIGIPLRQCDSNDPDKTGDKTPQQYAGAMVKCIVEAVSTLKGDLRRRGRIRCRAESYKGEPNPSVTKSKAVGRRTREVSQVRLFAQLCA